MLRGFTVTRANLQKDGYTLVQNIMVRYVESIFPVVRSIMESRVPSPKKPEKESDWSEEVIWFLFDLTLRPINKQTWEFADREGKG
jgi:hypothetical protein